MNFFDYLWANKENSEKLFVVGHTEQISFKELYNRCNAVSSYLVENFGTGNEILIYSKNSVFFIVSYLATIRSNNICVPIDYSIENSNFEHIMGMMDPAAIFCSNRDKDRLPKGLDLAIIDEETLLRTNYSPPSLHIPYTNRGDDVAQIIFTSGSTGKPKGVMLTHNNLISNTQSILEYLKLDNTDRICVVLPFHYCYGLSLLHTHLKVEGSIVFNNSFVFIGSVIRDIKQFNCTGFSGVPSHFQILLRKSSFFKEDLPSLKYMTQAGGKLHNQFLKEIAGLVPDIDFFVMYGQTEATARLSYLSPEFFVRKRGSIGVPVSGVEFRILDSQGNEVNKNEEGELVARGPNIMLGYYKDKSATESALKEGWLHTGDLAMKDEDGFYYIIGRLKEFIKVRGKRVSPKEIEEVILSFPFVDSCHVFGRSDELTGERVVAEVVLKPEADTDGIEEKIKGHCFSLLAAHKIPSEISIIEKLDMSSTGKKKFLNR